MEIIATSVLFLVGGLAGLAMWVISLVPGSSLLRSIHALATAFPQFSRVWLLAFPLFSLSLICLGAMFAGFATVPGTAKAGIATTMLALVGLTLIALVWALIPRLPLPPFLDPERKAGDNRPDQVPPPDENGGVTLRSSRPIGAALVTLIVAIAGVALLATSSNVASLAVGVGAVALGVGGFAVLILAMVKVTGLRIDATGLADRTTLVPRDVPWSEVVAVEACSRGVLVKVADRQAILDHTPALLRGTTGSELEALGGFVIPTTQLSLDREALLELIAVYRPAD